jgi:hypothetical protein
MEITTAVLRTTDGAYAEPVLLSAPLAPATVP